MTDAAPAKSYAADAIIINQLSKRFGGTQALDDVSFRVPTGTVFALLGENGAGKTTLIRILTGFARADAGQASVLSHDCGRQSLAIRRSIGYVSDSPAVYEWMTAPEIGWFTSSFYDDSFLPRYHELIAELEVPASTKIKSMSKGQRAKVALSLAIAHDPELLILDEPTSGLDPIVRRQFLESMVDRAAAGRTVLLSSHHINEVEQVADVVAIIHGGKLKMLQPLDTLRERARLITATLEDSEIEVPDPPGEEVLSRGGSGRQRRWTVLGDGGDYKASLSPEHGVRHVDVTVPTLEQVFVAVCGSKAAAPGAAR